MLALCGRLPTLPMRAASISPRPSGETVLNEAGMTMVKLELRCQQVRHSPLRTNCVILGSPPMNRSDVIDPETKSRGAIPA